MGGFSGVRREGWNVRNFRESFKIVVVGLIGPLRIFPAFANIINHLVFGAVPLKRKPSNSLVLLVRKRIVLLGLDFGHLDLRNCCRMGRKDGSYAAGLCRVIAASSITFRGKRTEN